MLSPATSVTPAVLNNLGLVKTAFCIEDLLDHPFQELELDYQEHIKALWCYQLHRTRPNFTTELIAEIKQLQAMIKSCFSGGGRPIRYLVWASRLPKIFNLGGDVIRFAEYISNGDRDALQSYAHSCIDICYANYLNLDLPITTVAVVGGEAYGGGFESVLSNDIICIEESVQVGFPEIVFGLFPGMGAYSFVSRRAGMAAADEMTFTGNIYRGEKIYQMGLTDFLAKDGEADWMVRDYLKRYDRRYEARQALFKVRREMEQISRSELDRIAEIWVETALTMDQRDVKRMRLIARAQANHLRRSSRSHHEHANKARLKTVANS